MYCDFMILGLIFGMFTFGNQKVAAIEIHVWVSHTSYFVIFDLQTIAQNISEM
jgi:hypothetical protein